MKKNGHPTKLATKPAKRKPRKTQSVAADFKGGRRMPRVMTDDGRGLDPEAVAKRVTKSLGAKPNTPELREAVRLFNAADFRPPGWWALHDGTVEYVGGDRERWFKARAEAVRLLSAKLGYAVSQDAVELVWSASKPAPPPMIIEFFGCVSVGKTELTCAKHEEKKP
jgi:hypothetical protein